MVGKIKGITLAIGGDTSGLAKAFDDVDSSLRKTQTELNSIEKALKLDPSNTVLLAQKERLLAEQTQLAAEKLKLLEDNQEKAKKALEANPDYQKEYQPLQQSIDETKEKLKKLQSAKEKNDEAFKNGELSVEKYEKFNKTLEETEDALGKLQKDKTALNKKFADTGHIDESQYRAYQREIEITKEKISSLKTETDKMKKASENNGLKKLENSLKDVNSKLDKSDSELAKVNKALKLDPTNITLVKQKQDILNESIKNTEEKLKTLKSAQSRITSEFKNGNIGVDQYRDFQRELETTAKKLESLKSEKKNISVIGTEFAAVKEKITPVIGKIEKIGTTIGGVTVKTAKFTAALAKIDGKMISAAADGFKKYSAAVGAATAATAGYAVSIGSDFESQMSTVQSISGATGDELEKLTAKAKEMGQTTQFSATEAAQGMEYMAMAGWNTSDITEGLAGIMNLAAASGEDLATTSDIVTDAMTAFGMSASESNRFADVLAKTASSANTNVSIMGETFKYVAPLAGAMGYSIEDMSVAIGLMANAGVKGSNAGTSLKNIITNLADPTDEVTNAMNELGVSLVDSQGNTKSFETVVSELRESFNGLTESEKAQYASTIAGKQGMSGMLALVNSSDDDYKALAESINNCNGAAEDMAAVRLDNLKGDITLLKSNVEGTALSLYEDLSPGLRESVQGVNELVTAFNEGGVDGLIEQIPTIIGGMLSSLSGSLQKRAPEILTAINTVLSTVITTLAEQAPGLINSILPALLTGFFGLVQALVNTVPTLLPTLANGAITLFLGLIDGLNAVIDQLMPMLPDLIAQISNTLIENLPAIIEGGFQLLIGLITGISECTPELINIILSLIPLIVDTVIENLPLIMDTGFAILTALVNGISDNFPDILQCIVDLIAALIVEIATHLPDVIEAGGDILAALAKGLVQVLSPISEALSDIMLKITEFFGKKIDDFKNIGKNILNGIVDGLLSGVSSVGDAINEIGGSIVDGFCDFFDINSPSRVMAKRVGQYLPPGIGLGMQQTEDDPVERAQNIVNEVAGVTADMNPITIQRKLDNSYNLSDGATKTQLQSTSKVPQSNVIIFRLVDSAGRLLAEAVAEPLDIINYQKVAFDSRG